MTTYDIHLILPEETTVSDMPDPLLDQLKTMHAIWPQFPCIGTGSYKGNKVVHSRLVYQPQQYISKSYLTEAVLLDMFSKFNLTWKVLGIREAYKTEQVYEMDEEVLEPIMEEFPITIEQPICKTIKPIAKATLLPYMNKVLVSSIGESPKYKEYTLDDEIYLPTYSGTPPIIL